MADEEIQDLVRRVAEGDGEAGVQLGQITRRTCGFRLCLECELYIPGFWWDEHKKECAAICASGDEGKGMRVVKIPTPGVAGGRPFKHPLYDRELLHDSTVLRFFRNPHVFAAHHAYLETGLGKMYGIDTNLYGSGTSLPVNHRFQAYGLSLVPDAQMTIEQIHWLVDNTCLEFRSAGTVLGMWPGRLVVGDQPEHVESPLGDTIRWREDLRYEPESALVIPERAERLAVEPVRDLRVGNQPLRLEPLSTFEFRLIMRGPWPWYQQAGPYHGLTVVLFGIYTYGIAA